MHEVFKFVTPKWANTNMGAEVLPDEALDRARELAASYYTLGVQTGIHSMIEWCGVMGEYVRMLEEAARRGIDPREVDQHSGTSVEVPDFMVSYFCEKLGCQLKPFIRANPEGWRRAIDLWFEVPRK